MRHHLSMRPSELSDRQLKAVWLALDSDRSGTIETGEFAAFVRVGTDDGPSIGEAAEERRARLLAANRQSGSDVRSQRHLRHGGALRDEMAGVPPAGEAEISALAERCAPPARRLRIRLWAGPRAAPFAT